MKAAFRDHYVSTDLVQVRSLPIPEPKPNEIQVKVVATTINRTDMAVVTGWPWIMRLFVGLPNPKSPVPGTDFVGTITDVGSDEKGFKIGDKVWGFIDNGCGSHAEYFCTSSYSNLRKIPDGIDWKTAVGSIEGVHYAYNFINKMTLHPGNNVLVIGGTGAIGSAAIQILKSMGVLVTAISLGHIERVKELGADRVIDGSKGDWTQFVGQFDAVFDAVGKSRFKICRPLLKENGIYISSELGPNWENPFLAIKSGFVGKKKVKFPIPTNVQKSLEKIGQLILIGKFHPLIDKTVTLDEISQAYTYVHSGKKIGNVILEIGQDKF